MRPQVCVEGKAVDTEIGTVSRWVNDPATCAINLCLFWYIPFPRDNLILLLISNLMIWNIRKKHSVDGGQLGVANILSFRYWHHSIYTAAHGTLLSPALRTHLFYLNAKQTGEWSFGGDRKNEQYWTLSLYHPNPPSAFLPSASTLGGWTGWTSSMVPFAIWLLVVSHKWEALVETGLENRVRSGYLLISWFPLWWVVICWSKFLYQDHSPCQETLCYNNSYYLWVLVNFAPP